MATSGNDDIKNNGHWQTVRLKYPDGLVLHVTLDRPTITRIESGDQEVLKELRKNATKSSIIPHAVEMSKSNTEPRPSASDQEVLKEIRKNATKSSIIPHAVEMSKSNTEPRPSASALDQEVLKEIRKNATKSSIIPHAVEMSKSNTEPRPSASALDDTNILSELSNTECKEASPTWSRESILYLISLYHEFEEQLEDPLKKKKEVWGMITFKMHQKGYILKQSTIESKWRNLVQSHKEISTHNQKTGRKRKTFQFFEEMEDILKKRHDIYPACLAGSNKQKEKKTEYRGHSDTQPQEADSSKSVKERHKRVLSHSNTVQDELLSYLKDRDERRKEEREERARKRECKENQRNELLRELISVLKN